MEGGGMKKYNVIVKFIGSPVIVKARSKREAIIKAREMLENNTLCYAEKVTEVKNGTARK